MKLGGINHVALTVSNLANSQIFYAPILTFLGYKNTEIYDFVSIWESETTGTAVNFWQSKTELMEHKHYDYAPGLHHLSFNAETREQVDAFYQLLLSNAVPVVEAPAEYDYAPGYYAVFFVDPDGIRVELTYIPC